MTQSFKCRHEVSKRDMFMQFDMLSNTGILKYILKKIVQTIKGILSILISKIDRKAFQEKGEPLIKNSDF